MRGHNKTWRAGGEGEGNSRIRQELERLGMEVIWKTGRNRIKT
jgi:hypothetical protein